MGLFFFNLLLRGDGYFPFSKDMNSHFFRAIVLFQTVLLIILSIIILRSIFSSEYRILSEDYPPAFFLYFIGINLILIFFLNILQTKKFAELGYSNYLPLMVLTFFISILVLILLWKKHKVLAIVCSAVVLKLYPILSFPITAKRSDMLPIIDQSIRTLLNGENVYKYFLLDNQVWTQNVRFPGLIISFIPAVVLNMDLRFILLLSEMLFFFLVYKQLGKSRFFLPVSAMLAFFPYWHYRHELYEIPFWIILLVTIFTLDTKKLLLHFILFPVLITFHQWGILFLPFLLIYLAYRRSFLYAFFVAVNSLAIAAIIVGYFCKGNFAAFYEQTFQYYSTVLIGFVQNNSFHLNCLYLTPEIAKLFGYVGLKMVVYGSQLVLIIYAIFKLRNLTQLFGFLSLSLLLMLLTNTIAWTYQYLFLGIFLWLGVMQKDLTYSQERTHV